MLFDAAENNLVIYTGTIGADFLEGFANPARTLHRKPGGASSMRIDYTRVPIWPFYGLKERLASALGSEVTGERFDGPDYDFMAKSCHPMKRDWYADKQTLNTALLP